MGAASSDRSENYQKAGSGSNLKGCDPCMAGILSNGKCRVADRPDWPLIVYGTACPEWLKQEFFQLEPSYPQAGLRAYSMAQKVLWMCDDILFLKQTSEEELKTPVHLPDLVPRLSALLAQENRWQRARGHITGRFYHEEGVETR